MLDLDTFNRWSSYHEDCFRGFLDFITERQDRDDVWRQALSGYSLAELKQASYVMFAAPEKPVGWTSHMEAMQRHLRRARDIQREQEQAAVYARRCGLCEGTGRVDVVPVDGAAFMGPNRERRTHHGVAACKCSLGDQYRRRESDKGISGFPDYDATLMEPLNVWRARNRVSDPERDEAAKSMKATIAYKQRKLSAMGTKQPTEPPQCPTK